MTKPKLTGAEFERAMLVAQEAAGAVIDTVGSPLACAAMGAVFIKAYCNNEEFDPQFFFDLIGTPRENFPAFIAAHFDPPKGRQ